jgi:hypothetical protein
MILRQFECALRFSIFCRNGPANCIVFEVGIGADSDISCLGLVNNSRLESGGWRDLVDVESNLTMANCTFRANSIAFLFGTAGDPATLILVRCVLDVIPISWGGPIILSAVNCLYQPQPAVNVGSDECPWPEETPGPTAQATSSGGTSRTESGGDAQTGAEEGPQRMWVIAISAGGGLPLTGVAAGCVARWKYGRGRPAGNMRIVEGGLDLEEGNELIPAFEVMFDASQNRPSPPSGI